MECLQDTNLTDPHDVTLGQAAVAGSADPVARSGFFKGLTSSQKFTKFGVPEILL